MWQYVCSLQVTITFGSMQQLWIAVGNIITFVRQWECWLINSITHMAISIRILEGRLLPEFVWHHFVCLTTHPITHRQINGDLRFFFEKRFPCLELNSKSKYSAVGIHRLWLLMSALGNNFYGVVFIVRFGRAFLFLCFANTLPNKLIAFANCVDVQQVMYCVMPEKTLPLNRSTLLSYKLAYLFLVSKQTHTEYTISLLIIIVINFGNIMNVHHCLAFLN